MRILRNSAMTLVLILTAGLGMGLAQGPVQKQIDFDINAPYALRMGNFMLPAGQYVVYQADANDSDLFFLFKGTDMMHSPIAVVRTVRIRRLPLDYPEHTKMLLRIDESNPDSHPVLRGWNIAGEDGWEIIAVVPRHGSPLTRAD
jgi:hypothetical protein